MYECKILADSVDSREHRLTTFQVTFPRPILAEVNTHRMLSRNSASSRAIPIRKSIDAVENDPFIPVAWGKNQPGMSASESLTNLEGENAERWWRESMEASIQTADQMANLEVHKSLGNRVLEPYKWHTAILSATDWDNFFALRTAPNAQPEFQTIARMMLEQYQESIPTFRTADGEPYHLPLVTYDEIIDESLIYPEPYIDWDMWAKVSIGRCARVSYLTHDGKRDLCADIELHDRLKESFHLSPFEHVARPFTNTEWQFISNVQYYIKFQSGYEGRCYDLAQEMCHQLEYRGNFHGWEQVRFSIPNQNDFSKVADAIHH